MNEVFRNATELKIQGQHLILGNPLEDEEFSWFSHRVSSHVLSEPTILKASILPLPCQTQTWDSHALFESLLMVLMIMDQRETPDNYLGAFKTHLLWEGNNFSALWMMELWADVWA